MRKSKLTPEESLKRIKLMMNYDLSRTLNEQLESPWDMVKKTAGIAGGAAALGAGVGAAKTGAKIAGGVAGYKAASKVASKLAPKVASATAKFGPKVLKTLGSLFTKGASSPTVGTSMWGPSSSTMGAASKVGKVARMARVAKTAGTVGRVAALAGGAGGGGGGVAAAGAAGIGTGAVGGAILAGAAALAVIPLVLWLIDKDQAYPKTKKLFEYVKNNKEKIDQIERGLDDDAIQLLSDDLYNAMKGLGTRNKLVYSVFDSLVTISDLSALISTFNEDHLNEGDGDLLEWLDDDFDISSMWNRIYFPVRNLVKKFAKQLAEENLPAEQPTNTTSGGGGTYKPCTGTYSFGCESESIRKIQGCLGLVEDGKFGPKTQVKLGKLGKGFDKGFTDADVETICSLAPSLIQRVDPLDKASTSNLKLSNLVPKLDTTTLRPAMKQPVSIERMKEIQNNIRKDKKYVGPPLNDAETAWLNDYMKKLTGKTSQVGKEKVKFA
jgi:hypothetical protein